VNEGIARLLARDGYARIDDAVGADLGRSAASGLSPGVSRTP